MENDPLSHLWDQAKAIRLTAEESAEIHKRIFAAKGTVREGVAVRHTERMQPEDLFREAQKIRLSREEAKQIDQRVYSFMRKNPLHPAPSSSSGIIDTLHSLLSSFRFAPAFVIAALITLGTSLSVAASSSLPGDFLYPIKVHVNEPVAGVFQGSADARAHFEAMRLEKRLEEAARLAAAGRLHGDFRTEVSGNIATQLERMQKSAEDLAISGDTAGALDVHSQVESNLVANAAVLSALADNDENDGGAAKADVRELLSEVSKAEQVVIRSRVAAEKKANAASPDKNADARATAETGLRATTKKIDDMRTHLDKAGMTADGDVLAQANARFEYSKKLLRNARTALDAGEYPEAQRITREAERAANEAKVMLKVAAGLKLRAKPGRNTSSVQRSSAAPSPESSPSALSPSSPSAGVSVSADGDAVLEIRKDGVTLEEKNRLRQVVDPGL